MYKFLNQSNPLLIGIVPLIVVLLFFVHLDSEMSYPMQQVLSSVLQNFENSTFPYLLEVLGAVILISTAYLIASLNTTYKLTDLRGNSVAFIFLLLTASLKIPLSHPAFWANLVIFFSIYFLLTLNQTTSPINITFLASLLLTISSFFVHTTLFFLPIVWLGLALYGIFSIRLFLVSISGFSVPFIYMASIRYIFYDQAISTYINEVVQQQSIIFPTPEYNIAQYFMLGFVLFLCFIGILEFFSSYYKLVILRRKSFRMLILLGAISPFLGLFLQSASIEMMLFATMPAAFLIVRLLSIMRKNWMKNLFIWILILGAIVINTNLLSLWNISL